MQLKLINIFNKILKIFTYGIIIPSIFLIGNNIAKADTYNPIYEDLCDSTYSNCGTQTLLSTSTVDIATNFNTGLTGAGYVWRIDRITNTNHLQWWSLGNYDLPFYETCGYQYFNSMTDISTFDFTNQHVGYYLARGDNQKYVIFYNTGTEIIYVSFPFANVSQIYITNPYNETLGNNPVIFSGFYENRDTYDNINLEIESLSYGQTLNTDLIPITLANGTFNWSKSLTLGYTGNYRARARLVDTSSSTNYIYTNWSSYNTFALGTTTNLGLYEQAGFDELAFGYEYSECSALNILCYVKNSAIWLFIPEQVNINNFKYVTLASSTPFAYLYQLPSMINSLYNTTATTTATTTISLPLKFTTTGATTSLIILNKSMLENAPMANTMKTVLSMIMYFLTAITTYRIVKNVFIKN